MTSHIFSQQYKGAESKNEGIKARSRAFSGVFARAATAKRREQRIARRGRRGKTSARSARERRNAVNNGSRGAVGAERFRRGNSETARTTDRAVRSARKDFGRNGKTPRPKGARRKKLTPAQPHGGRVFIQLSGGQRLPLVPLALPCVRNSVRVVSAAGAHSSIVRGANRYLPCGDRSFPFAIGVRGRKILGLPLYAGAEPIAANHPAAVMI